MTNKLTPEQIKEARVLRRSDGIAWHKIAERFGVNAETIQRQIDPEFDRSRKHRRTRADKGLPRIESRSFRPTDAEYQAARNLIPPDDRDLTGRLMGDPVIGRRAIDMRRSP